MFRIRKIHDDTSPANRAAIEQVMEIMRGQFPLATEKEIVKIPLQLQDPMKYRFRSILIVAEDASARVRGFALLLHVADLDFCYLEFMSVAPGKTGGGLGSVLYDRAREEALSLKTIGLFFECLPDEEKLCAWPETLQQNTARMRFYERYNARPIINNQYATPVEPGDMNLFFLVYDDLGQTVKLTRERLRKIVRAVLERKYGDVCSEDYIEMVVKSFQDDPPVLRAPRYTRRKTLPSVPPKQVQKPIVLIMNQGHEIHHVRDRGYVEAPVRIASIISELEKTGLFVHQKPKKFPEKVIKAVHAKDYVDYFRRACETVPAGKSVYPIVFPLRNALRHPKDLDIRSGYYCMDTFTPLNHNAYLAARGAVNCAMTGAEAVLDGNRFAYALVRPPGHHAESRAFGGFCYFNSAAVAAQHLSQYGRIAVLDVDFHHGNGTQDIFYARRDVLTVSIHGDPHFAYPHFAGFKDETGYGEGEGYNINYPLPEQTSVERYQKTLARALKRVREFDPAYLVLCLGLDTAKADPTGTWALGAADFRRNGEMIGALGLPTLIVQEGGYRTRTLGVNARHFFEGLWAGKPDTRRRKV